ncbi:protein kinase [Myxococcus sp. K15C18031901]|uniref:serine/threonine protein kinase n=1 Tax=Myxococcus dinghuensis TaxID=2906761 RepID=UPI0020A79BD0|nr:serine/threonine-protein kinase [Myxococcus dinghuensis]MCP3099410.1 protein kinase [Myxococcus dinghuensis]
MSTPPAIPFGRYELLAELGRGGMAETWRARLVGAAGVTKPVLIKKVLPEFANDEAFTSMFIREASISTTLSHGNIAQVFDFGELDGQHFLAMELVDGQPLHRILKRVSKMGLRTLPVPLAVFIALEMCRGLHYAHTRTDEKGMPLGIVHRDISPDNVLVSYEGQVKIVDFGIAKARMQRTFDTAPGIVRGKYLYFSPEQARGREVDGRTDVWATGLVLYEMLCGQTPVAGTQATVMMRMAHGEFTSPRGISRDVPAELDAIVMKALAVDLQDRFESAHAFGDALAGFLFSVDPRFSSMSLAHLVRVLFREDLHSEGRELTVPPDFTSMLARWQARKIATPPPQPPRRRPPAPPAGPSPSLFETAPLPPRGDPNMAPTVIVPGLFGPSSRTELLPRVERGGPWKGIVLGGGLLVLGALVAIPWSTGVFSSDDAPPSSEAPGGEPQWGVAPPMAPSEPVPTPGQATKAPVPAPGDKGAGVMAPRVTPKPVPAGSKNRRDNRKVAAVPGSTEAQRKEAERLSLMARRAARKEEFKDAFLLAEDCLSNVPNHAECLLVSGAMLNRLGSSEDSIERYRAFVRHHPDHERAPRVKQILEEYDRAAPRSR